MRERRKLGLGNQTYVCAPGMVVENVGHDTPESMYVGDRYRVKKAILLR